MGDAPFSSRSELDSQQVCALKRLLETVVPANPFYTAKLRDCNLDEATATREGFSRLPFTSKLELVADQAAHPPFGSNLTFALDQYTRYHQTSGTTGTPLRWLDTPQSWEWMVDRWLEIFQAAAVHAGDRILFAFSFGPFIGFWLAFQAGERLGALCLPAGGVGSLARVRMLLEAQATVLCCTPTYALHLAETAAAENIDLSRSSLRTIIVAGEAGGSVPATRARLESLWPGARVFDHHGMTETGPVSFECPARPGVLHICEPAFLPEVLDPATSEPAKHGEGGELILTTLGRLGSPVIRYRTGDLVKLAKPDNSSGACLCGRHSVALEGGILGRVDDMVIIRGVNVYPTAVEDVLRSCGQVAEYQVRVSRSGPLAELRVTLEPEPDCSDVPALVGRVSKRFLQAFALRVPVEAVSPGTLPRYEMKGKRWIVEATNP